MAIPELRYVLASIWREESNRGQRMRRLLFFAGWQVWKRVVGGSIQARLFNGFRVQVRRDFDASTAALYYSIPNSAHICFLRKHLNGGTFLDVGANIGLVSLLVADKVEHALLFEPNPAAAQCAKDNLRLNGLLFEVFAMALSDTVGTVELENAAANSCNRTVDGFMTSQPTITVPRTTFDEFLRARRSEAHVPAITAVKIDVEGHENAVIRGMQGFLKTRRPKLVMFEYLARTDIRQVLATFQQAGYSVFELSPGGPRLATQQVAPLQDLFACPTECAAEFDLPCGKAGADQAGQHLPRVV